MQQSYGSQYSNGGVGGVRPMFGAAQSVGNGQNTHAPPYGNNSMMNGSAPNGAAGFSRSLADTSQYIRNDSAASGSVGIASTSSKSKLDDPDASRATARMHYEEFKQFLEIEGSRDPFSRQNARDKLTRLTRQQFQELSTDVYDELVRRNRSRGNANAEYLPEKPEFHPKRNAARQKLATLPKTRFRDLASDVFYELERRYPEFVEPERPFSQSSQPQSQHQQQPSLGRSTPQGQPLNERPLQQSYGGGSNAAANEVIVPNKSKLTEEDVGGMTQSMSQATITENQNQGSRRTPSTTSNDREPLSPTSEASAPAGGLRGLRPNGSLVDRKPSDSALRQHALNSQNRQLPTSPEWENNATGASRASETSSIGTRLVGAYGNDHREWDNAESEKLKSDYEYKIATMQNRISTLESEVQEAEQAKKQQASRDADLVRDLEERLKDLEARYEAATSQTQRMERDLQAAQADSKASRDAAGGDTARVQRELQDLQAKHTAKSGSMDKLQAEFEGLVDTLKEMNIRQDELVRQQEEEQNRIVQLEDEARDWKKRYESAKTELRNVKATSQLYVPPTGPDDDFMPTSPDGAILDTNVTAFQSSIDDLLIGGRSNAPSSVIIATKQVINAVARIDDDVQSFESRGGIDHFSEDERDRLNALKSKCNATLSNLTTAARNHATGQGLSPVSLLDAAASHLTVTIIDLVRMVGMRKGSTSSDGTSGSQNRSGYPPLGPSQGRGTVNPGPRVQSVRQEVDGARVNGHSSPANRQSYTAPLSIDRRDAGQNRSDRDDVRDVSRQDSQRNASISSDMNGHDMHGHERDIMELRNYLEAQTESIVHAIQGLLTAIRGGSPTPKLDENLSQIITIVSSVLTILRANIPAPLHGESEPIMQDLQEFCDKLVELQTRDADAGLTAKQANQQMANASFGIAKGLKSMNNVLGGS